jgi:transcriptional regulator with XRE-family HTH domain
MSEPLSASCVTGRIMAANLKRLRLARGMSQHDLSKTAGIAPGMISFLEAGKRSFTVIMLEKISHALNVTPETLIRDPAYRPCAFCHDLPFAGYVCGTCGKRG